MRIATSTDFLYVCNKSWDSLISIVTRLRAGWQGFYLRHRVQTGSGAHPGSYPEDTGIFPRGKAAGA